MTAAGRAASRRGRRRDSTEYCGLYAALTAQELQRGSDSRVIELYARGCSITELAELFELSRGQVEAQVHEWALSLLADIHEREGEGRPPWRAR